MRRPVDRRRGVTLIELLVALVVAGLVATFATSWIVHAFRQAGASQRRDDREQELALLRNELFQDGSRGRTLELGRSSWKLARPAADGGADTVEWRFDPGGPTRNGRRKLSYDTLVERELTPRGPGLSADWDPWTQVDRDFDGLADPEHVARLERLDLRLVVRRAAPPGTAPVLDTLRVAVPLLGPG